MKKVFYPLACLAAGALVACGGQKSGSAQADQPNEVALAYSKSLKAPETDSLKLLLMKTVTSRSLMVRRLTDGVVMEKTKFLLNGLLKTVVSNLTEPVAVKRKTLMAAT